MRGSASGPSTTRRSLTLRAGWVTADQVTSSLANFLLTLLLARQLDVVAFGAFALAMSVALFLLGVSQTLTGQVLAIRHSGAVGQERHDVAAAAVGTALVVGLAAAAGLLVAGALAAGPVASALTATALVVPGFFVQDSWRSVFVARGVPMLAFLNDLLWLVVQFALVAVLLMRGVTGVAPYLLAWGLAALVAAAAGCGQARVVPQPFASYGWLQRHWDIARYLLLEWVTVLGSMQVVLVLVAWLGSVSDVGAIRGAQTLLGPLNIVGLSVTAFAIPELSRRRLSRQRLLRAAGAVSALLVAVAAVYGALLLVLPPSFGQQLLGDTWAAARVVLPAAVAYACANALKVGPESVLRSVGRTSYILVDGMVLAVGLLVLSVVGLRAGGAEGAMAGMALAAVLVVPVAWSLVRRATGAVGTVRKPASGADALSAG